jgi:hydrogenase nickel incorporation protein HypB
MFRVSRYAIFTKLDLLPHVDFDLELAIRNARSVNPDLRILRTSSRTETGLDEWLEFLREHVAAPQVTL